MATDTKQPERIDGQEQDVSKATSNVDGVTEERTENEKHFSEEQVKEMLQSEADRRVTEAKKKWDKEKSDLLKKIELNRMTEDERAEALMKQKEQELEEKAQEIARREADFDTVRLLAEKKLPTKLLDALRGIDDMESRKQTIILFESLLQSEVARVLVEKEKGTYTTQNGNKQLSREDLASMSHEEINRLFATPEGKKQLQEAMKG